MRSLRTCTRVLAVVATIAVTASVAWLAPASGELDPTFSGDGKVFLRSAPSSVEALADGGALSVEPSWLVRRFTAAGPRDTTFGGGDGMVMPDFGMFDQMATDTALQPDGKLVIVGSLSSEASGADLTGVARLTPNGALDPTFSDDGLKVIPPGPWRFMGSTVSVTPTGRIVVAGTTNVFFPSEPETTDAAAVVLTAAGARSRTFGGGDGIATVDLAGDQDTGEGVAVQPDGKIVLVLTSWIPGAVEPRLALARLTSGGALDASFSGDGRMLITFRADVPRWQGSYGGDVEVHAGTGDVYAGGSVANDTDEDAGAYFAVARVSSSGMVERRWTTLGGHLGGLSAISLVGRDVVAVGSWRWSVADCCAWSIARFGSVEYLRPLNFEEETDFNGGAFDVDVVDGKAFVVGDVSAEVNGQSRSGAVARFIA